MNGVTRFADRRHHVDRRRHARRVVAHQALSRSRSSRKITNAFEYYTSLRKVHRYVADHYPEPLSLAKAARVAGVERTYFSTFFREKVGISFTAWLRHFRIKRAIRLMREHDLQISEVAFEVGFGDLRTFERAFKKCTGRTARDFKRSSNF